MQIDNAATHNKTKRVLFEKGITRLEWPALSLDLNPIENVWSIMDRIVKKILKPETETQLRKAIKKAFMMLKRHPYRRQVLNCITSVPKRLRIVQSVQGDHCGY